MSTRIPVTTSGAMLPRRARILLPVLFVAASVGMSRPTIAQSFDFDKTRIKMAELAGQWRFKTGDDLRWKDPDFDDSKWALLRSDGGWSGQGYPGYGGIAWYRFKITFSGDDRQMALCIPRINESFQVFANGEMIGEFGGMPPNPRVFDGSNHIFRLPRSSGGTGQTISVAIRVWHWPLWARYIDGGSVVTPLVGEIGPIRSWKANDDLETFWEAASRNVLLLIGLLAGIAALTLFALRRMEREYLWFGIYELLIAARIGHSDYRMFYDNWFPGNNLLNDSLDTAASLFFLTFIATLLRRRKDGVYWSAVVALGVSALIEVPTLLGWIGVPAGQTVSTVMAFPYYACVIAMIYSGIKNRVPDARLLISPVLLSYTVESVRNGILIALGAAGPTPFVLFVSRFFNVSRWPFPILLRNVTDLLMQLSALTVLLMRFARSRREEQRMAGELESARAVQNVLIPSAIPTIPGFEIASVYRPATQVGGDFFQIISTGTGGVLLIIGDVSGKGMPAAMTVSLLVGTVRTLAHYTDSPRAILTAMNQRMLARTAGGFTTCMVLRADSDGTLTIANAGHLAPYRNGIELTLGIDLPLGIHAASTYDEAIYQLSAGETLTLLTDGVVEARGESGELFGFERTSAIATASASEIAKAAQDFGQDDDITVLTITRACRLTDTTTNTSAPALSPSPA